MLYIIAVTDNKTLKTVICADFNELACKHTAWREIVKIGANRGAMMVSIVEGRFNYNLETILPDITVTYKEVNFATIS